MLFFTFVHFKRFYIFSNTNKNISNTIQVVSVNNNEINLNNYESISEDIKYVSNSLIRLKILATLYEGPLNMKEINDKTNLSYSSISSNMHKLELGGFVYRESNKYYISNSMMLHMEDILELKYVIDLLNKFFNILDSHIVDVIPNESIAELFLLGKANLIESDGFDVYKTYNYIENILKSAESVKCILPFYYENFNKHLTKIGDVDLLVNENVLEIYKKALNHEDIPFFKEEHCFLLIITEEVMVIGLFRDDGNYDQNRLLTSKNDDCLKWANNLFKNFKNKIINENQTHL